MIIDIRSQKERSFLFRPISFGLAFLAILMLSGMAAGGIFFYAKRVARQISEPVVLIYCSQSRPANEETKPKEVWQFVPGPISMEDVKRKGCVADGFLNDYGEDRKEMVRLIEGSECVYLHRALETWLRVPDFDETLEIMERIKKRPIIYGMFLAEAIKTNREYHDPLEDRDYKFKDMCRKGTEEKWTTDSCVPSIQSVEYRRYLKAITRRAMDLGIQSFLFGQVVLQDGHPNYEQSEMKKVVKEMRDYAKSKGMQIIIGGQTDNITEEKYLRLFDYVEGGLGLGEDGRIEEGPCWSRMSDCWALLWHERYSFKANNVLLHLDWSGLSWDDMGVFTRMDHDRRIERLRYFYNFFTSQNMGFLMPYLAVINHENDGCYGPNKSFYSPSKKYRCQDENDIKKIMRGQ